MVVAGAPAGPLVVHLHPEVWLLVASLVAGYVVALRHLGPRLAPPGQPVVTRRQIWQFGLGVALVWAFAEWPVHDIAERSLFSVHMTQHTAFSLVAPPLLLLGTPAWLLGWLLRPPGLRATLRRVCRPLPASLLFNAVVIVTHWPPWVTATVRHEPLHFAAHLVLFSASLVMWLPVVNRRADLPTMTPPARMLYVFLQSIVPTVPASFLAFAERPLYPTYATAARITGLTAVEDQQLAGAVMKVGGTTILWTVIVVMFFRWYQDSQRDQGDVLTWEDVERELHRTKPATP